MLDLQNILVVRTDRIGDLILTTPTLLNLRKAYPSARITLLVAEHTKSLVENNPNIDALLTDDKQGRHKGFLGYFRLLKEIRKHRFDAAFVFHTKKRTNLLCYLAGIPHRIGYRNEKYGFLLTHPLKDTRHHGTKHEVHYCLDVLKYLDIPAEEDTLYINIDEQAKEWVDQYWKEQGIDARDVIAIHPGASDPSKCWPARRFIQLIDGIDKMKKCQYILFGSNDLDPISREIIQGTDAKVFNFIGQTTLAQMVAMLNKCQLLISNDSGPVHVAAALNVPIVTVFLRNQPGINPERWYPYNVAHRILAVPLDKEADFRKARPFDEKTQDKISIEQVLEAVDALIKLC